MSVHHTGVNTIQRYPFSPTPGLVVNVLGKQIEGRLVDWRWVVSQVGSDFKGLAHEVYRLGKSCEKVIVCPIPEHGNEITSSKHLKVFKAQKGQAALYRGRNADGAEIQPGEVYALASADCPTVAIHDPLSSRTIVCHFSRQTGVEGNILEIALSKFAESNREELVATVSLGISAENFEHDWLHGDYGTKNKEVTWELIQKYGRHAVSEDITRGGINLRYIAIAQLLKGGIPAQNIYADTIDTFSDPAYWSHRASHTEASNKFGDKGRNMVLVANL